MPPHFEHGCEIENRPWPSDSIPRPWQREQTVGAVPGFAPVPLQVRHGADPGTVLEVVEKGYRLDDTVLRPARVVVSA